MTDVDDPVSDRAVTFTDVHRVLSIFADGVAGQPMDVELTGHERAGWPWEPTVVSGAAVRMPPHVDEFDSDLENRRAFRATVLHQTGFAEFGTYDIDADERERQFKATPNPAIARRVFGILEDLRVDEYTMRCYPGALGDLARVRARALGDVPATAPIELTEAVIEALRQHSLGASHADLPDELARRVGPGFERVVELAAPVRAPDATVHDSVSAALGIAALVHEELDIYGDEILAMIRPPDDAGEGTVEPRDDMPRPDGDIPRPPSHDMQQQEGDNGPIEGHLADVLPPDIEESPDDAKDAVPKRKPTDLVYPPPLTDRDGRVYLYDEWDHTQRSHRVAWCRVIERKLVGDDFSFIGDVRRRYAALATKVRRQFSFLRPDGWVRVHHADEGDELDIDAVIEAIIDRRTGHAVDDRLHIRRERAARDVATAFLVDLSASTSSPLKGEEAPPFDPDEEIEYRFGGIGTSMLPVPEPRRSILDVAKESVALMCDALDRLGDRHAVYGFSGEGRHAVDFHIAKDFDDRTSGATWASIAAMSALRYTRMGPAVRHATAKLAAQPCRTKLLIVISDGYPQDIDYGPTRGDKEYGLQDTARALQDARNAGIATYCVTIDPAGHDYLRRMCPDRSYVVIDDVPSLPAELARLYGKLAMVRDGSPAAADPDGPAG